jgi:hypothetical protein
MKVFLDDVRPCPEGWVLTMWPEDVIKHLETGKVTHLSLDHDLGDDNHGTGYDVLLWLEEKVFLNGFRPPNHIFVHSSNSSAAQKMNLAIKRIKVEASKNEREI